jgi:hypothetical protein
MSDLYPPAKQRPALQATAKALNASPACLRRDDCSDWRISGRAGHLYAIRGTIDRPKAPGFSIFVSRDTPRGWTAAKAKLGFAQLTNDGDAEGMLFLDRLPTASEAEAIRSVCGIRKRRSISEETLAASVTRLAAARASIKATPQPELLPSDGMAA